MHCFSFLNQCFPIALHRLFLSIFVQYFRTVLLFDDRCPFVDLWLARLPSNVGFRSMFVAGSLDPISIVFLNLFFLVFHRPEWLAIAFFPFPNVHN